MDVLLPCCRTVSSGNSGSDRVSPWGHHLFSEKKEGGMTIQQAARTALDCQDACNLSGVLASFKEIVHEVIWPEARRLGNGTEWVNRHPICILFLSKLCSLNGGYYECDYLHASDACEALAQPEMIQPETEGIAYA